MRIAKCALSDGTIVAGELTEEGIRAFDLSSHGLTRFSDLLEAREPSALCRQLSDESTRQVSMADLRLLAPIDRQEIWAAGVTYKRSRSARMEESETAASCYDRVYESPRPEIFMKATPHRVSGPGEPLRIRADATWNVPEPELTLVCNSRMQICGATIGNDMSSRDIEGDNPLYLPQAKVYDQCAGLGPCITLFEDLPSREKTTIQLSIIRDQQVVFGGETNADQLARTYDELVHWLARDNSFPDGVFLMTGTGIVPDSTFTLAVGDRVRIEIAGIGTLENPIVQSNTKHEFVR